MNINIFKRKVIYKNCICLQKAKKLDFRYFCKIQYQLNDKKYSITPKDLKELEHFYTHFKYQNLIKQQMDLNQKYSKYFTQNIPIQIDV